MNAFQVCLKMKIKVKNTCQSIECIQTSCDSSVNASLLKCSTRSFRLFRKVSAIFCRNLENWSWIGAKRLLHPLVPQRYKLGQWMTLYLRDRCVPLQYKALSWEKTVVFCCKWYRIQLCIQPQLCAITDVSLV